MADANELVVRIVATTTGLTAGLEKAGAELTRFDATVKDRLAGAAVAFAGLAAAAVAAGAAIAVHLVSNSLEAAAALDNLAKTLGINVEALQELEYAGQKVGIQADAMAMAIRRMSVALERAATQGGPAAHAVDELHLSLDKLANSSPDEQFIAIADALNKCTDQSKKMLLATELFGREGPKMLSLSRESIEEYAKRAQALGLVLSTMDVKNLHETQEALEDVGKLATGFGNALAVEISPLLHDIAEQLTDWVIRTDAIHKAVNFMVDAYWEAAKVAGNFWNGVKLQAEVVELLILKIVEGVLHVADKVAYGFQVMGEIIRNVCVAIGDTFGVLKEEIIKGIDFIQLGWAEMIQAIGSGWATALNAIADGMAAAGIKGSAAVKSAAGEIAAATGSLSAQYQKQLEDQTKKTDEAAAKMKTSWKGILSHNADKPGNIAAAEDSVHKAGDGAAQSLNNTVGDMKGNADGLDALRKELKDRQKLRDDAAKKEKSSHVDVLNYIQQADKKAGEKINQQWEAGFRGRLEMASDLLGQIGSLMEVHNRKAFEVGKIAAIGAATVDAIKATISAFAAGMSTGGPYAPAIAAAYAGAAAVAGFAQVAKIASTQYGGGGGSSSMGGGSTSISASAGGSAGAGNGVPTPTSTGVILHVPDGMLMDGKGFRKLIDQLNKTTADGATLGRITVK